MLLKNDFGLSLGLHIAVFLACLITLQQRAAHAPPIPPLIIELDDLLARPRQQKNDASKQVVRTREAENASEPDSDAFLGERNQKVERQTVTTRGGLNPAASRRKAAADPSVDLSKLGVAVLPSPRERREAAAGDAGVREYVSGVQEGEETALSTREFVFFGYFERIRGRLDRAWEPILRDHLIRHYRLGRRIASEMDHRTEVLVVLDQSGKIVEVDIVGESGTETLDSAAVEAFNRAGPFPNPPRGLIAPDGRVRIKWEFILKT